MSHHLEIDAHRNKIKIKKLLNVSQTAVGKKIIEKSFSSCWKVQSASFVRRQVKKFKQATLCEISWRIIKIISD